MLLYYLLLIGLIGLFAFLSIYGYDYVIDIIMDYVKIWLLTVFIVSVLQSIFGHNQTIEIILRFNGFGIIIVALCCVLWTMIGLIIAIIKTIFGFGIDYHCHDQIDNDHYDNRRFHHCHF